VDIDGKLIVDKGKNFSVKGKGFFAVLGFLGIKYVPTYLLVLATFANMGK